MYVLGGDLPQWGSNATERGGGMLGWDEGGFVWEGGSFREGILVRGVCVYAIVTLFERRRAWGMYSRMHPRTHATTRSKRETTAPLGRQ